MPTYKFNPDKNNNLNNFVSQFEVYDPISKTCEYKKILYGQTFTTNTYYSQNNMKNDNLEFISDEPYISPIIYSYNGNDDTIINVPDYGKLVNIILSMENDNIIKLYFNNNSNNSIILYHSGIIFKNILLNNIRVINIENIKNKNYSISIISTTQV